MPADKPVHLEKKWGISKRINSSFPIFLLKDFAIVLTEEYLDEIKQRAEKASPGPWISYVEGRDHRSGSNFIMTGPPDNRGQDIELLGATIADQDFIAHARIDIPILIDELKRLRKLPL